jgi:hypothetical protein
LGRIKLKDDEPETVRRMIEFLYTSDYDKEQNGEPECVEVDSPKSFKDQERNGQDNVMNDGSQSPSIAR